MTITVRDLEPGDELTLHYNKESGIFVGKTTHPVYTELMLVIFRMYDGTWQHNTLSLNQELDPYMGTISKPKTKHERRALLRKAFKFTE